MTRAQAALRGWLFGLCSAALAVSAHGVAGGGMPDTALTVLLTALIAWAGTALADRLRGVVAMLAVLAVTQLGLHVLLTDLGGTAGAHAGHSPSAPVVTGWAMFACHAVATMITALLLTRASAAITVASAALDRLVGRLHILCASPVAVPAVIGISATAPERPGQLLEVLLRRVSSRRGPPIHS